MDNLEARKIRKAAGMTQRAVAEYLGTTVTTVYRYEAGEQRITSEKEKKYKKLHKRAIKK